MIERSLSPLPERSRRAGEALSAVFIFILSFLMTPKKAKRNKTKNISTAPKLRLLGVLNRSDIWVLVRHKIFSGEQASIGKSQPNDRTGNEAMSLSLGSKLPAPLMGRFCRKSVRALLYSSFFEGSELRRC